MGRRVSRATVTVVAIGVGLVVLAAGLRVADRAMPHRPYRMTVRPEGKRAVVRLYMPHFDHSSLEIPADLEVDREYDVDLRNEEIAVPGCQVESFDAVPLPGRFMLKVGGSRIDVRERGIVADGKEYPWRP